MNTQKIKKKRYFPSSFAIIFFLMLLFIIASWIGSPFNKEIHNVGFLDVFTSIWRGFISKAEVILFIFAIGGTLGIMTRVKAIENGISVLSEKLGNKTIFLIPVLMLIFGLGGSTYGMWEETIGFIPILVPIFKKAKLGTFTAGLTILLGAGTGCLASTINPFSVSVAVDSANETIEGLNLQLGHAQATRWISFLLFEIVAITFVLWIVTRYRKAYFQKIETDYEAKKFENNFSKNFLQRISFFFTRARVVEGLDNKLIEKRFLQKKDIEKVKFTVKQKVSLGLFVLGFLIMILLYLPWGSWFNLESINYSYEKSMFWFASTDFEKDPIHPSKLAISGFESFGNWYFISIAALFTIISFVVFIINIKDFKSQKNSSEQEFISEFVDGTKLVISVCLLISFASGLGIILEATGYGPLIAKTFSKGFKSLLGFVIIVFLVSLLLSFFVPSTSGFAAVFIPIFAQTVSLAFPESSREVISIVILAFLFSNGIINLISPTSAALVSYTNYVGIPFNVWVKETWKITFIFFILSLLILVICALIVSNGASLI